MNKLILPSLSEPKIQHLYPPPPAGAVLYLPGYPPMGSTIRDFSGNNNHGTIFGATWVRRSSGLWGLDFDGIDDKVSRDADVTGIGGGLLTFETWVKRDVIGALHTIFSIGPTNQTSYFYLQFLANNKIYTIADVAAVQCNFTSTGTFTDTTKPYHLMVVYDGTATMKMYLNGESVAGTAVGVLTGNLASMTTLMKLGIRGRTTTDTEPLDGQLYLPRVYNADKSALASVNYNQMKPFIGV